MPISPWRRGPVEPSQQSAHRARWLPRLVPYCQRTEWGGSSFNRFFRRATEQGYRRAVGIENEALAELGAGGILAPVMFWTPTEPDREPAE